MSERVGMSGRSEQERRKWSGVPSIDASVYADGDGNSIIGHGGEWMLLTANSLCGPFRTLKEAKAYLEENDV